MKMLTPYKYKKKETNIVGEKLQTEELNEKIDSYEHLPPQQKLKLKKILWEYRDVFSQ